MTDVGWGKIAPELDGGYRATFARLARIFRSRGLSAEEADDLAQEAVARTLSHLDRHGRRGRDLTPLLNTIAKNLVVERFRSGGREVPAEFLDHVPADDRDPSAEVVRREGRARLQTAIADLPPRQRDAVRLWLAGEGPAGIARMLGLKRNAADALLHRARRQLAAKLEDLRGSVWGTASLAWLRLREAVRRVAASVVPAESVPAMCQVLAGVITIAMLVVVPISTGREERQRARAAPDNPLRASELGSRMSAREALPAADRALGHATAGPTPDDEVDVDIRSHRVAIVSSPNDPVTNDDEPVGLIFEHERDPNDRGVSGPLLDEATETICTNVHEACEGG